MAKGRSLPRGLARLALGVLVLVAGCARPLPPKRPNVVFVLTDDQRWDMLGAAGNQQIRTPHLDRLAAQGTRFSNAFVTTSLCSPSRASFLTGLYGHSHRVLNNFTELPSTVPNLPRKLHDAGYETAYIGKWHMGEENDEPRPGFDHWMSHKGGGSYRDTTFNIDGVRRTVPGYYTTVVTEAALGFIERPRERPFFLVVAHKAPHSPNLPEEGYANAYDAVPARYPASAFALENKPTWIRDRLPTWHGIYGPLWDFRKQFPDSSPEGEQAFSKFVRSYMATINSVDDSVGRIMDALSKRGVLDDTVVVFASDNGFFLGEHGMMDKRAMHEPSIRIPFIVRYPRLPEVPRVVSQMVLNVDLAPSLLELCQAAPLAVSHGRSWVPLLRRETSVGRSSFLYEYNYEKQFPYTPNVRGVRTETWKFVHYPHGDGGPDRHMAEMYDLAHDPGELRNLADDPSQAHQRRALEAELARLLRETGAAPDRMPLDEGIKAALPDPKIR